jgi:hypothetical protein
MRTLRSSNSAARPDRFRTVEGEGPESAPLRRSGASDPARESASLMLPGHERGACHHRAVGRAAAQVLNESDRPERLLIWTTRQPRRWTDAKRSGLRQNHAAGRRARSRLGEHLQPRRGFRALSFVSGGLLSLRGRPMVGIPETHGVRAGPSVRGLSVARKSADQDHAVRSASKIRPPTSSARLGVGGCCPKTALASGKPWTCVEARGVLDCRHYGSEIGADSH